jgi:lipid-A-disaccharide synthase
LRLSSKPLKVFISTAEVSGDLQAAVLVSEWLRRSKVPLHFDALGGPELKKAGAHIFRDLSTRSSIGFIESLPHLFDSFFLLSQIKKWFLTNHYDLVILVDGQGRNIPIGKLAKNCGIKTVYYFPPPVSIWGKWNIKTMRRHDLLLCPFEDDAVLYRQDGQNAIFTGHPFSEYETAFVKTEKKILLDLNPGQQVLSLFPGSRYQELRHLVPLFLGAAKKLKERLPELQIVLSVSHPEYQKQILSESSKLNLGVKMVKADEARTAMMASDFLIASSGTTTLQAAFYGLPMAICYRVHPLTYALLKPLIKTQWIGLPNLLAKKTICREFINRDLHVSALVDEALSYLNDSEKTQKVSRELFALRSRLSHRDPFGEIFTAMEALFP